LEKEFDGVCDVHWLLVSPLALQYSTQITNIVLGI